MRFIVAFYISIALLTGTVIFTVRHKENRLLPLTVGTYLMLFTVVFPFGMQGESMGIFRNVFLSFVKTAQIFGLNSEFDAWIDKFDTSQGFAWAYSIWLAILYTAAPILTAGFLISFSHRMRSWFKWIFNRRKETWIFSEPSEKALLFAGNALRKNGPGSKGEDACVVFCGAGEQWEKIGEIGAIALKDKIDELDKRYLKRNPTLFFMTEDEDRNLEQTLDFAEKHKNLKKPALLYCFSSKPEAGLMLNAVSSQKNSNMKFRRIAENRALVYRELPDISASVNAGRTDGKPQDEGQAGKKKQNSTLHFLIVGCGWIGTEMLKALLWCFVRYDLIIDVIDKTDVEKRFWRSCPGLKERNGKGFKINFLPNEDIRSFDISSVENAESIDYAFVALGNDIINTECAVYLRQAFRRLHRLRSCGRSGNDDPRLQTPEIHVVISNPDNKSLDLVDHKIPYGLQPFINGQNYYTADTLLNYETEKKALLNHLCWELFFAEDDKAIQLIKDFVGNRLKSGALPIETHTQWRRLIMGEAKAAGQPEESELISGFYNDDYNCWSSRARAVFDQCDSPNAHSAAIEHKRWLMYMLTEGYRYGEKTDHIAKLHADIRDDFNDARDLKYEELLKELTGK